MSAPTLARGGRLPLDITRRAAAELALGAALVTTLGLAGCGFVPSQPPRLAAGRRVALRGFDRYSGVADELRRQIRATPGARVVEAQDQADLILAALEDKVERVVAASTAAGLVTDLTLRTRLRFEVRDPSGRMLIDATELLISRDMSYGESVALAKEHEARMLLRSMQTELASQVLRRMAALPGVGGAGAAAASAAGG
ncbi:MAG: hypothetical protein RL722_1863 [Pseudomonadota bacterium]|jgi:LPS-assembly lipoprotein